VLKPNVCSLDHFSIVQPAASRSGIICSVNSFLSFFCLHITFSDLASDREAGGKI